MSKEKEANRKAYPITAEIIDLVREYFPNAQVKKTTEIKK